MYENVHLNLALVLLFAYTEVEFLRRSALLRISTIETFNPSPGHNLASENKFI